MCPLPKSPIGLTHLPPKDDTRGRILAAAARLIDEGGRDSATSRAVATAAGVQAPAIYRLFGDMRGLLDAAAIESLNTYIAAKAKRPVDEDPVQDLRHGWDMHVTFGLTHPGVFEILSGDPQPGPGSQAAAEGLAVLQGRVRRIALAGSLRTSEERAVSLLRAAATGTVFTLLSQPKDARDAGLSTAVREATIAAITVREASGALREPRRANAAAAELSALLGQVAVLSDGERHLLTELLQRIAQET